MILKLIPSQQITKGTKQPRYTVKPQNNRLTRERLRVKAEWRAYGNIREMDKENIQNSADKHATTIISEEDVWT